MYPTHAPLPPTLVISDEPGPSAGYGPQILLHATLRLHPRRISDCYGSELRDGAGCGREPGMSDGGRGISVPRRCEEVRQAGWNMKKMHVDFHNVYRTADHACTPRHFAPPHPSSFPGSYGCEMTGEGHEGARDRAVRWRMRRKWGLGKGGHVRGHKR
uniref:Uncharacterized protein n=1 Tax=Mycena chlorophos TaxID=658473 RepID=A0ABQ0L2W5_MYCCL|nr:predicted protein [Mycena chlorophos]